MKMITKMMTAMVVVAMLAGAVNAAVILSDDFTGVTKSGNTASFTAWDTVNGIDTPDTDLSFYWGSDGTTAASFHDVTANEIDVNRNMTDGGWDTAIVMNANSQIDLTTLVLNMRLTNGSGGDQTTNNKLGRMAAVLEGSVSGTLGTVDPGDMSYPSDVYVRTLDLSGLPALDGTETYTLTIQARGSGWGHHKSFQAVELSGDVIPEPASALLMVAAMTAVGLLRRKFQR